MRVKYLLLLLPILFILSISRVHAIHCDYYITSLPYTIDKPGVYCLNKSLIYNGTGNAITINTSNVVIDCLNHSITTLYYPTLIYSGNNSNITIENCEIIGRYAEGIRIDYGNNIKIINDKFNCEISEIGTLNTNESVTASNIVIANVTLSGELDIYNSKNINIKNATITDDGKLIIDNGKNINISNVIISGAINAEIDISDSENIIINNATITSDSTLEIDDSKNINISNVNGNGSLESLEIWGCENVIINNVNNKNLDLSPLYGKNINVSNVNASSIDLGFYTTISTNIILNNITLTYVIWISYVNNLTILGIYTNRVEIEYGYANVTLINANIGYIDIYFSPYVYVKIINSSIHSNITGVYVYYADGTIILNNTKIYNVATGINITNSSATIIAENISITNASTGILIYNSTQPVYIYNSTICHNIVDINISNSPVYLYNSYFDTVYPNVSAITNYPDHNYYCNGTPRTAILPNVTQNVTIPSCPQHLNESNYVCIINTSGTYYIDRNLTNVTIYVNSPNVTIDGKYHKAELNITLNVTTSLTLVNLTLENSSINDIHYSSTLILRNVTIINSRIYVENIIILTPLSIADSSLSTIIYGNNNTIYINNSNITGEVNNATVILYHATADIKANDSVVVAKNSTILITGENSKINLTDSIVSISDNRNCYIYANNVNASNGKVTVGENSTLEMYNSTINPALLSISNNSYAIWFENITDPQGHPLDLYVHVNVTNNLPFTADCYISSLRLDKHYRFYVPPNGELDVKFYGPFILVCQVGRYVFTLPVKKVLYNTSMSQVYNYTYLSISTTPPRGKIIVCINNGKLYLNGSLVVDATAENKTYKSGCYVIETPELNKVYSFSFEIEDGWIFGGITYGGSIGTSLVTTGYNVTYVATEKNGTINVSLSDPRVTVVVIIRSLPLYHNYLICVYGTNGEIIINGTPYKFEEAVDVPTLKCINVSPGVYNITIPKVYYDSKGDSNIFFGVKYFNGSGLYPSGCYAIVNTSFMLDLPYFNETKPRIGLIAYFMKVPVEFVVSGYGEIDNLAYTKISPKGTERKTTTISLLSLDVENNTIRAYFPTPLIRDVRILAYALGYPGLVDYGHSAQFLKIAKLYVNATLPESGYFILEKMLPEDGEKVNIIDIPEKYFVELSTYNITKAVNNTYYYSFVEERPDSICLYVFAYLVKTINNTTELESPIREVYILHCITWNTSEYRVIAITYDFAPLLKNESYIIANIHYLNKSSNSYEVKNITIPLDVSTIHIISEKLKDATTVVQSPYLKTYSLSYLGITLPENPVIYVYYHINVTGEGDYLQQMEQLNLSFPLLLSGRYDSVYPLILKPSLLKNGSITSEVKKFDVKITKSDLAQTIYVKINYSLPYDPIIDYLPLVELLSGKVLPFRNLNPTTISIAYFYPQQYIVPTLTFEIVILKTNGEFKKFVCTYHNVNLSKGSMTINLDTDPHCSESSVSVNNILFGKLTLILKTLDNKPLNGYVTIDNKQFYVKGSISIIAYGETNIQVPKKIDNYKFVKWSFGSLKVIKYSLDPYAIVNVPEGSFVIVAYYNTTVSPAPHITPNIVLHLTTITLYLIAWMLLFIGILLIIAGIILIRHGMKK